ncbi:MAG: 50S ribosomal protein L6 [Patescibacteria group bacterium]
MSRLEQNPVVLPEKTELTFLDGSVVVKGPKGTLSIRKHRDVEVALEDRTVRIRPAHDKTEKALLGLTKALVANMVEGVNRGFSKTMELEGIGYKVALAGNKLVMALGFSHPVEFPAPDGIVFQVEKNVITISGVDKALVGQTAANLRKLKKPEPYKGKGIRYQGEVVRRKEGKKAGSV